MTARVRVPRVCVVSVLILCVTLTRGLAAQRRVEPPGERQGEPPRDRTVPVVVASKPFGESYLLAEMFAQLLESRRIRVQRRFGLGATEILFGALRTNAIDVYPEYTGTGLVAILHDSASRQSVFSHVSRRFMELYGIRWLPPLGFENTYAIAVRRETAARHRLATLSDLARASARLEGGFTADFIGRADGLAGLARVYGMRFRDVRPLSPALKYQALATGGVDVIDGYSTDGLLARYDLVTLADDKGFFPPYDAAAVLGPRAARERTDVIAVLSLLSGRIDVERMRVLNKRVEVDREDVAGVARDALAEILLVARQDGSPPSGDASLRSFLAGRSDLMLRQVARHLVLVGIALFAAILIAVPLGVLLERTRRVAEPTVGALGVVQTIPSIALLAFMLPLFGIGVAPALVALWLYALYPIARATYSGVRDADPEAVEAAEALGTTAAQRLMWVRLPLAAPVIMSGVRTAAVITVGAATLAAFVGAGGLGEPIVEGLALADTRLILSGAIPAAALALLVDGILALIERQLRPAHLRSRRD
jgi:osmoprotectant transport system permease protein